MSEWQPIETAPKDGTAVLAFQKDGRWLPGTEETDWEGHHADAYGVVWWDRGFWEGYYEAFGPFDGIPTHWMPLPEPPNSAENEP